MKIERLLNISDIKESIVNGNLDYALEVVETLPPENLEGIILKSKIFQRKGYFTKSLELIDGILNKYTDFDYIQFSAWIQKLWTLYHMGHISKVEKHIRFIDTNFKDILNELYISDIAYIHALNGFVELSKGNLDRSFINLEKSREAFTLLGDNLELGIILNGLGILSIQRGEYEDAIIMLKRSLVAFQGFEKYSKIAHVYNNLGGIYQVLGNLEIAFDYFLMSLDFSSPNNDVVLMGKTYNNIGNVFFNQGDYDKALEFYLKSLNLKEENVVDGKWASFHNIGMVYFQKQHIELALEYYEKALMLQNEVQNPIELGNTLLEMVVAYLTKNDIQKAKHYFQDLASLNAKSKNKFVELFFRYSEALIIASNPGMAYQAIAEGKFTLLCEQEIISHEITISSILQLCKIKLNKLESKSSPYLIDVIQSWMNSLLEIAYDNKSFPLLIETMMLKAKFEILTDNHESASKLLNQAELLASDINSTKLIEYVEQMKIAMDEYIEYEEFSGNPFSLIHLIQSDFERLIKSYK